MNKTTTPTHQKFMFPLRLPPDLYKQVRDRVQAEKDTGHYSYSINEYLTELIEKEMQGNK